jgi:hypothetical protein
MLPSGSPAKRLSTCPTKHDISNQMQPLELRNESPLHIQFLSSQQQYEFIKEVNS